MKQHLKSWFLVTSLMFIAFAVGLFVASFIFHPDIQYYGYNSLQMKYNNYGKIPVQDTEQALMTFNFVRIQLRNGQILFKNEFLPSFPMAYDSYNVNSNIYIALQGKNFWDQTFYEDYENRPYPHTKIVKGFGFEYVSGWSNSFNQPKLIFSHFRSVAFPMFFLFIPYSIWGYHTV